MVSVGVGRRREGVLAMSKHFVSIAGDEAAGLGAEVEEAGIGLPPAQGPDGSLVDARYEQSGGTTRAEALGLNLVGRDVGDVLDSGGGSLQFVGDLGGGDVAGSVMVVIVGVEWSVRGAPWSRRWRMHHWPAQMGQRTGSPERPWPSASPWVAFFWSV